MHRSAVALIWLAGAVVAALAYVADPGAVLALVGDGVTALLLGIDRVVHALSRFGAGAIRAMAIGLFVTFVALSLLAIRQGRRGRAALVTVSTVFVLLVHDDDAAGGRWIAALVLVAAGALVMTGRLRRSAL